MWQGWIGSISGIWLIFMAFLGRESHLPLWNLGIGFICAISGLTLAFGKRLWNGWVVCGVGLGLLISSVIWPYLALPLSWIDLTVGVILSVIGILAINGNGQQLKSPV